ncbi:DUF6492 family protein [Arthrobacter agilis]|uniref:DUF6492 family protein n=1 Tax=Arthrobacter agilis TaxID=37921 RepID=UPI0023673166|nr:DUF6492 family protein [Arthrobacter agilis]WDF34219.1 DUF6492 family protein [Arthrobacter agilis]
MNEDTEQLAENHVPCRPTLAVVTPSYAPDRDLCEDLNRSVLEFTGPEVLHHIVVPKEDVALFHPLAGDRTVIHRTDRFLPRSMIRVPPLNAWVNLRRPFPPVRGWIGQQIVKLSIASVLESDVILLVDSDTVLVRPLTASTYAPSGFPALFRLDSAVDESLPRHRLWHQSSRRLLGLPPAGSAALPDYICWPCAWRPDIVRSMLTRIERVTGRNWSDAVGGELYFSEMILYGVYVEEVLGLASIDQTADMRCLSHSEETPLDAPALDILLASLKESDLAVMISAKSHTELEIRRRALRRFFDRVD